MHILTQFSENDPSPLVRRLDQNFKSHLTKLVMLFALDSMCKFNMVFQNASTPETRSLHRLPQILLGQFVLAETIQGANNNFIDEDPLLQLPIDQLGIGQNAWAYLSYEEDSLDSSVQRLFLIGSESFLCLFLPL